MEKVSLIFIVLYFIKLSTSSVFDEDFKCRISTCQAFYHGLKHLPRYDSYAKTCTETVSILKSIPTKFGKCFNERNNKLNANCIYALATTIKNCIAQLSDLPETRARYYCGFTLMKYCAAHIGLEKFPLNLNRET